MRESDGDLGCDQTLNPTSSLLDLALMNLAQKLESENLELRNKVTRLEEEIQSINQSCSVRRYNLEFVRRSYLGEDNKISSYEIRTDDGGIGYIVAIHSDSVCEREISFLADRLHDMTKSDVIVVAVPPGSELSVFELIPKDR